MKYLIVILILITATAWAHDPTMQEICESGVCDSCVGGQFDDSVQFKKQLEAMDTIIRRIDEDLAKPHIKLCRKHIIRAKKMLKGAIEIYKDEDGYYWQEICE